MNRRGVIKRIVLVTASAALLPRCNWFAKKPSVALNHLKLDGDQEETIGAIVDTLIPATDIPGAKALNVTPFVLRMLDDCTDDETQTSFAKAFSQLDELSKQAIAKPFIDGSPEQKESVLMKIESDKDSIAPELKKAYSAIRQFTIRGFMGSQYVMTEIQKYEMIPGRFHGCFPVATKLSA